MSSIVTDVGTGYDPADLATGPGRVFIAPTSAPIPADPYAIVPAVADANGLYPAVTPWRDSGLSVDAPSWTHSRETAGLEFEQTGVLFDRVTDVSRTLTADLAGLSAANIALVENVPDSAITEIASAAGKPGGTRIDLGIYRQLLRYRVAVVFERADEVLINEPGGGTRPAALFYILPLCQIAADNETEVEVARGEPVHIPVTFRALPIPDAPAATAHGFWFLEQAGTITGGGA